MSIKDWLGFGDKKQDRQYNYPDGGIYGDRAYRHYEEVYNPAQQYYEESVPPKRANSMPPLKASNFALLNCAIEKMSVEKLLSMINPIASPNVEQPKNSKENNTQPVVTPSDSSEGSKVITSEAQTVVSNPPETTNQAKNSNEDKPAATRSTLANPKELIVIVVENMPEVLDRAADALKILDAVLESHKDALFLISELGKTTTYFELSDYEDIVRDKTLDQLFNANSNYDFPRLSDAFLYINRYLKKKVWPRFDFKDVSYRISACNIICLGSRDTIDIEVSNDIIAKSLSDIYDRMDIKIFKYLCLRKEQDITVFSFKIPEIKAGIYIPIKPQSKDIIVFMVENTPSILAHKNTFIGLLNQIATNQKKSLFFLAKVGSFNKYTELIDYDTLLKNKALTELFDDTVCAEETQLAGAMEYIEDYLKSMITGKFKFQNIDCIASSFSFVCIGTGSAANNEDSKESVANCIKVFTRWSKTKNLKYLCVHDYETVKVATLGFPDIKHIVTNFYN